MTQQTAIPTNKTRDDTIAQALKSLSDNLVRFTGALRVLSMQIELLREGNEETLDMQERLVAATNRLESTILDFCALETEPVEPQPWEEEPVPMGAGRPLESLPDEDDDFLNGAEITQVRRIPEEEPPQVEPASETRERIEQHTFAELSQATQERIQAHVEAVDAQVEAQKMDQAEPVLEPVEGFPGGCPF